MHTHIHVYTTSSFLTHTCILGCISLPSLCLSGYFQPQNGSLTIGFGVDLERVRIQLIVDISAKFAHWCTDGRVVKALDSKSNGLCPRRFESCSVRFFFFFSHSPHTLLTLLLFFSSNYLFLRTIQHFLYTISPATLRRIELCVYAFQTWLGRLDHRFCKLVRFAVQHHSRTNTIFHAYFPTTATLPVYSREK